MRDFATPLFAVGAALGVTSLVVDLTEPVLAMATAAFFVCVATYCKVGE